MCHQNRLFTVLLAATTLLGTPAWMLAKGGGGGGHGGGGGGHSGGGGGHCSGGHSGGSGTGGCGYTARTGGACVNGVWLTEGHWGGWTTAGAHGYGGYGGYAGSSGYGWGAYPYYDYGLGQGVSTGSPLFAPPPDAAGTGDAPDPNAMPFPPIPFSSVPPSPAPSEISPAPTTLEFIERGELAFKAGDYADAVHEWRHGLVDDPQNGLLMMMLAQALFATGDYREAAFATEAAMQILPSAQWGVVVCHYTRLYGDNQDYASQLQALERETSAKPGEWRLHFLSGFQFGYHGKLQQAIEHLDQAMLLAPHDEMTDLLRNELRINLARSAGHHAAHGTPPAHGYVPTRG